MAVHPTKAQVEAEEIKFRAEQQVKDALMATPVVKKIKRTEREMKKQATQTKRNIVKGMKKK